MEGEAAPGEGMVHGFPEIRQRVEQRPVQIEYDYFAGHAAKLRFSLRFRMPLRGKRADGLAYFREKSQICCRIMDERMELIEAVRARHSVRKYIDRPIEPEKAAAIRAAMERINRESGLNVQLVLDEPKAFSSGMWKYGQFSLVKNYLVMAGPKGDTAEERIGYHGEELVLLAQTLGLNTCWVGLTYKKIPGTFTLRAGDIVHCVIALGYGASQGVQHPMRPAGQFYESAATPPEWFLRGIEAAILAPTAVNQQKFKFFLHPDGRVDVKPLFSMAGYTRIDLGIVKYHFEIGAGKENYEWV